MDAISGYISTHPAIIVIGVILIVLLFLNFIFKNLIRLIIIALFFLLAAFGYYYFHNPVETKEKVKKSVQMVESGISEIKDKSKNFYQDGKELYKKTKEAPGGVNKLLDASDKELEKELKK